MLKDLKTIKKRNNNKANTIPFLLLIFFYLEKVVIMYFLKIARRTFLNTIAYALGIQYKFD